METLLQIPQEEARLRISRIQSVIASQNIDALCVCDNADIYYCCGRVFSGYVYIPARGEAIYFVRRPVDLTGEGVEYIRKPEDIPMVLVRRGYKLPANLGMELDIVPYSMAQRLSVALGEVAITNASPIIRQCRSVKTPYEIEQIKQSGVRHEHVYRDVPALYQEGMTDVELQVEIERRLRLAGCLGQFRISGNSMELHMGNLICGDNADNPSPYDFAMGGAGLDPSLPVGCNGTIITPGMTVMVDMNGNFTGYMTDMTRTFSVGKVSELAQKAHDCSIEICHSLSEMGKAGVEAKALYNRAAEIVAERGLDDYFMGHRQKAGFVGHGVGIEVNETPVIAPRSRDVLIEGNVIALEPKFVIPAVGAVGIENTYLVTTSGLQCLTHAPEEIISLD